MNKNILLISLFISSISLSAQVYDPLPTSNAVWTEYNATFILGFGYQCFNNQYEVAGDTTVNSIIYHKLNINGSSGFSSGSTYCSPNSNFGSGYSGAFRNDSLNKKVYYIPAGSNAEQLLYDFDLLVGDTLPLTFNNPYPNHVVTSIRTVSIANKTRRVFDINYSGADTLALIEGIGTNRGLLASMDLTFDIYTLECFKENNVVRYPDTSTSCNLITSIQEVEQQTNELSVYPNPSNGSITLSSNLQLERLAIFNHVGQLVQEFRGNPQQLQLPAEKGVYFIRATTKNGYVVSEKVVRY